MPTYTPTVKTFKVWYTLGLPGAISLQLTVCRTKWTNNVGRAKWDDLRGWVTMPAITRAQAASLMRDYRHASRTYCPTATCEKTR